MSAADAAVLDPRAALVAVPVAPGAEGFLRLVVARVAGRTRIVDLECSGPIQVLRCHSVDSGAPDVASVMIASPSGGVLQGDRLRMSVEVRAGARLLLETQSATRLYRMPNRAARIETRFRVEADSWLRYVPDAYIPFAGSETEIETVVAADPTARVVIGEVVAAGRVARGEILAMRRFESSLTAVDLGGRLRFTDATLLEGGEPLGDVGMLGAHLAVGSVFAIAAGADPVALRAAVAAANPDSAVFTGASTLPNGAGAWLRVLARDLATARSIVAAAAAIGVQADGSRPA